MEEQRNQTYEVLNKAAIQKVRRRLDPKDPEDKDFMHKLPNTPKLAYKMPCSSHPQVASEPIPQIARCLEKKSSGEGRETSQQLYAFKGKGQWHLMKHLMKRAQAKHLLALRGTTKGPRGLFKGSITTNPKEIDLVIRVAYGKIFDCNT